MEIFAVWSAKNVLFLAVPNMSVLLHVSASNQIEWLLMYCQVGSCVLQNILSLKVSNCLDQDTISSAMDPKWPMETVKCGRISSIPEKCPTARAVNVSVLRFVKSLLRCEDCQISPQLTNTYDITWRKREGELWVGKQEVGVLCSVGKASRSPSSPSGSTASSFGCLVFSYSWKKRLPSPYVSAEQCAYGQPFSRTSVAIWHWSLSLGLWTVSQEPTRQNKV